MRSLGLDIGGTSVKAALLVDGRPIAHASSPRYTLPDRPSLIRAARDSIDGLGRPGREAPIATGLCVPGRRDQAGSVVLASINVPGLVGHRLDELVAEILAAPGERLAASPALTVTSDAHAAAVDIAKDLPPGDIGPHRVLAISLGTGVGACVLDGLSPLEISGRSPGHFGQIDVSLPAVEGGVPIGPDGGRGGLEAYIGLPALLARLGPPADTALDRMSPDDPALLALARALRIAHAIYRPHTIALLGGVGIRLRRFQNSLRTMVDDHLTSIARPDWRLLFGTDDHHAARGVARLAASDVDRA